MVSLTEAFNNAIKHGNKMDTTKSVVLETGVFGSYFWARITDQGLGFDSSKLPDPLKNENITKQNGRGVFLIEKLSTAFSYKKNRSGYHVNMLFDLNKVNL
ncbi:MAG: hypothetical protein Kapaf2KO_05990 [Candidatus Kapaibacteriales bacterium]